MSKRVVIIPDSQWKSLPKYPGIEFSDEGEARSYLKSGAGSKSLRREPLTLRGTTDPDGYIRLNVKDSNGVRKIRGLHQLIAETFLSDSWFEGAIVCHNNGDPSDNRVDNLRWGTRSDNQRDMAKHKRAYRQRPDEDIREIRRLASEGVYQRDIAKRFGVSQAYVWEVVHRKRRQDVE